ncbi:hypothetical protein [Phormidium sp. CCY1219]|uniref:hypothetical protein n=1 Tax=Phormidium sp. CCY1219 TaxID=2886104 RepID=UPI002D1F3CCE|nr:hypothetical protein [Phormidium sp. CCY1219]MEB3829107.1 hypothetical protein [Phormidium sp. CCY1219]
MSRSIEEGRNPVIDPQDPLPSNGERLKIALASLTEGSAPRFTGAGAIAMTLPGGKFPRDKGQIPPLQAETLKLGVKHYP